MLSHIGRCAFEQKGSVEMKIADAFIELADEVEDVLVKTDTYAEVTDGDWLEIYLAAKDYIRAYEARRNDGIGIGSMLATEEVD